MTNYKILIPRPISSEGLDYLKEKGYQIKFGKGTSPEIIAEDVVGCDAILVRADLITAKVLEAGRDLKVVSRHGVGIDNIDVKRATELGIYITNALESNANTVAEYVIGMLFLLSKRFIISEKALRDGDWELRNRKPGIDLESKTLGLIGMGKVGSLVAQKAVNGLSMQVIGYDPYLALEHFPASVRKVNSIDDILNVADFISIHVPYHVDTINLIGEREFGLMKKNAFFINAARGEVVDENALFNILKARQIAGAGIDVFTQEPIPNDHPFFQLDNIILTPHIAALTKECTVRMALQAAQGIHEVLSGITPTWWVNKEMQKIHKQG